MAEKIFQNNKSKLLASLIIAGTLVSCAQESNENFELSIEGSVRVTTDARSKSENRCDPSTQLDCSAFDFVLDDGTALDQQDAFASCTVTAEGDLRVEVTSSSEQESSARAVFRVHRNASPQGAARCEGIKFDSTSESGYLRSSCDVIIQYGRDIFAATPFEHCKAIAEVDGALRGTISCPLLRTGSKRLIVNKISYFCAPTEEVAEEEAGP